MKRRQVLTLGAAGLLAMALAGCTSFAPVYGDASGAGLANARFNFAAPTNRLEQVILNRLAVAFPNPAGPNDPTLRVSAKSSARDAALSRAFAVGTPVNVRVEATITIVQGEQTLFSATRFVDSAYQSGSLTGVDLSSAAGTDEQAAESAAEALRAAVMAGYRPGSFSTPVR